ncbi:MAG: hypothetical protein KatS3mg050_0888 [Litorilinea sp.]|nr:MAG: hypothetical protein KatS3mg050_0888 [Litorilinea sp.]
MNQPPIFVVGVPRSGTTLLAAMLAAHSRLSCGPETHFFRRLQEVDARALLEDPRWPQEAARFICDISHSTYAADAASSTSDGRTRLIDKYGLEEAAIADFLQGQPPSLAAMLASVTEQYMHRQGKVRWAEKTPDHLALVHLIRRLFPASPIVRIVRDPRDVAISLGRVPWGAQTLLEALFFWRRLDDASSAFFVADPNSYTLRYEDLITEPRQELQKLCRFLGEPYEEGMLDTSRTGRRINARQVPWKDKVSQPIDSSRVGLWRGALTPAENRLAEAILGDRLARYGYPQEVHFNRLGELFPDEVAAGRFQDAFTVLAGEGIRFWKAHPDERPAVKIYLGNPGDAEWLGDHRLGRGLRALSIAAGVVRNLARPMALYWVPGQGQVQWPGYAAYLLQRLLTPYRVSAPPQRMPS